jgi:hypothetical protein
MARARFFLSFSEGFFAVLVVVLLLLLLLLVKKMSFGVRKRWKNAPAVVILVLFLLARYFGGG